MSCTTPPMYHIWGSGEFAHICFASPGCKFRKKGYCLMCNYGSDRMLSQEDTIRAFRMAQIEWGRPIKRLLLGSYGSIFDETEMSISTLSALLQEVKHTDVCSVIFETHYSTLNPKTLEMVTTELTGKQIAVEMGFESSNPIVLKHHLNKYMDLDELKDAIDLLHANNIKVILNVFLGSPGLSTREQLIDSIDSVRWAYSQGADEVVVFPANVKPNTFLWTQWKSGKYTVPSSWMLSELLHRLTDKELETTSISWYGDRQYQGIDLHILPPATCPSCKDRLIRFYSDYMKECSADYRRTLIEHLISTNICSCQATIRKQLQGEE